MYHVSVAKILTLEYALDTEDANVDVLLGLLCLTMCFVG